MTSENNPFTVPTNGILYLRAEGSNAYIYAWIETFVIGASSNWNAGVGTVTVPVFKGMKVYETVKLGTTFIGFVPFES